ncbi:MAG: hypothetical protein J0L61_00590 [Planctomycetes bacterium]|nr:hypothetical protein [Planctomycetota bacterium]
MRFSPPLILTLLASAAPAPSALAESAAVWPDNARIRDHISAARTRRIAVVGLGDSNQLYNSVGWDDACTQALGHRYALWGTGLISFGESVGFGSSVGAGVACHPAALSGGSLFQFGGAPRQLDALLSAPEVVPPSNYLYIPPGVETESRSPLNGLILTPLCGLELHTSAVTIHLTHGLFPSGLALRAWVSPYDPVQEPFADFALKTQGAYGAATTSFVLPPGLSWGASRVWVGDERARCRGPFLGYYMQAEQPSRTTGAAFHTLFAKGGASARDMAASLLNATDAQLTLFFSRVRAPLGPEPRVTVRIVTGVNDRSEGLPSAVNTISPGNSPAAFRDNIMGVVNRLRGLWASNDWDAASELRFVLAVSPPMGTPDDPSLIEYRSVLRSIAAHNPDTVALDFSQLVTPEEMLWRNWYEAGGLDRYHFTALGHAGLVERELEALIRRDCWEPADFDNSGEVNTRDLLGLLEDFGRAVAPGQGADASGDGAVNTADLALLLSKFGAPTCNASD